MGLLHLFLFGCLPRTPPHPPALSPTLSECSVLLQLLLFTSNCRFFCPFLARQPRFLHCLRCYFGATSCNRCPCLPLPVCPMFVVPLTFFACLGRIAREQPFLGGFRPPTTLYAPNQGVLPHNPSRLITSSVFSLHYDAFFSSDSHFFLCSYSAFVGESLQFANFFGDILPLRVRVIEFCLGLVFEVVVCLGSRYS